MKKIRVLEFTLCAFFTALTAITAQISIPIGPVPINLAHIAIFIAAGLLGAKYGAVSQIVYVLLGAVGVPVFSQFTGGFNWVVGPTGGFLIGYIACAFVTGLIIERFGKSIPKLIMAMYGGWIATYVLGILWFMHVMEMGFVASLAMCFFPFIIGDLFKTILSAILINRLYPVYKNRIGSR